MAWSWQTYREWTNSTKGQTIKVLVAAGLLASGGMLWWERAQPRYPTARDEAEIIGALQERRAVAAHHGWIAMPTSWDWSHLVTMARFPVLAGGVWSNEWQYNAVGLYPRRSLYTYDVSNTVSKLCSTNRATYAWPRTGYADLRVGGGTEGNDRLWGRPWDGANMLPFADGEIMDLAWWQSNIWADAGHFGDFAYIHRKPFYMGTNMLNEIGKALSAFRWTWEEGSDPTNRYPPSTVSFLLVRTGTSEFEEPVDAETAIDAACANMAWVSPYTSAELENLELASHYAYVAGVGDYGATVHERITTKYVEKIYDRTVSYFAPVVTGTVARVTEHAVLRGLYAESMREYDRWRLAAGSAYHHGRGFNTNMWEAVELEAEELEGHTTEAYRSFIRTFEGGFDIGDMQTLLGPGCIIMGWSSGPQCFVVDWKFQCLTNRAAFWDD